LVGVVKSPIEVVMHGPILVDEANRGQTGLQWIVGRFLPLPENIFFCAAASFKLFKNQ